MRRIIYNMMICCAAAWLLAACSKDDDLPGGQTGGNGNSIILDISSGALPVSRATVPAEGAEVAVSHIDVLIFNDTDEKTKVWSDRVKDPVAVRYAWGNNPDANLFNDAGLPAVPFRTDGWKGITE